MTTDVASILWYINKTKAKEVVFIDTSKTCIFYWAKIHFQESVVTGGKYLKFYLKIIWW